MSSAEDRLLPAGAELPFVRHKGAKTKRCPSCQKEKPLSDFPESKTSPDGTFYYCRKCYDRYLKDSERIFIPKACWVRGRHAKGGTPRDALLHLLNDIVIVKEFVSRCESYGARLRARSEAGKERNQSVPRKPVRECPNCGAKRAVTIRSSWVSPDDESIRVYYMRCRACASSYYTNARITSLGERAKHKKRRMESGQAHERQCPRCGATKRQGIRTSWPHPTDPSLKYAYIICKECDRRYTTALKRKP